MKIWRPLMLAAMGICVTTVVAQTTESNEPSLTNTDNNSPICSEGESASKTRFGVVGKPTLKAIGKAIVEEGTWHPDNIELIDLTLFFTVNAMLAAT